MKELTVISGKGGTGKTTITGSFASLAENAVLADCDIDAPDLELILSPEVMDEEKYVGTFTAERIKDCSLCGKCKESCRFNAINEEIKINKLKCEGCGVCEFVCPENAIKMEKESTGTIYSSNTRFGPLVHAELDVGEEASGKMVTRVRDKAKSLSKENDILIVDGSPGTGCPVISSIKGSDMVLVVSEPTVSGIHDLKRVLDVGDYFDLNMAVCINKFDINKKKTEKLIDLCVKRKVPVVGKIPYDEVATEAMLHENTVVEFTNSKLSESIEEVWMNVKSLLEGQ